MKRIPLALAPALVALAAPPAAAQNGYSFTEVDLVAADLSPVAAPALDCSALLGLTDYDVAILAARPIPRAGPVPAHCRIDGVIRPEIVFQVNLPQSWNGRFYMHGNGGYAGQQPDSPGQAAERDAALAHAFATATTDTGHNAAAAPLATFAFDDLGAEIDYAFRAVHLTAVTARRLIETYYERGPAYAYWDGCSTGGRQGLMSAQRFPEDFDGIVAGAPVLDFTGTQIWGAWNERALAAAEPPITIAQMASVAGIVYGGCDALDGLEDGLIDDPRACPFDPAADLAVCDGEPGPGCFTESQIAALAKVYGGVVSGEEPFFPGLPVGAEAEGRPAFGPEERESGWAEWLIASDGGPSRQGVYGRTFLENMAFEVDDPDYDWTGFDFDEDPARMGRIRMILDATSPDLHAFAARGGRMITYFGWADTALNPLMGVGYYEAVMRELGDGTGDVYRLFMAPGMFHCRGGLGPDRFDAMRYLIDWVEQGVAPDRIVAAELDADGEIVRTRPLCPYPQVARHDGEGGPDAAEHFVCGMP